jgi:CheY-like chemotaxis protein
MTPPDPAGPSGDSNFDLSDFFTKAARRIQAGARRRGVLLLFDYEGPLVTVRAPQAALGTLLDQVLLHAVSLAPRGSHMFLRAKVDCSPQALCSIDAHVVGGSIDTGQATERQALEAMAGAHWTVLPSEAGRESLAHGYCEAARARLIVHAVPPDGTVVRLQTQVQATELHDDVAAIDARGARAWLIADPSFAHEALARRLHRFGWTTTLFHDVSEAVRRLLPLGASASAPALVLASELFGVSLSDLAVLVRSLPATSLTVYTMPKPDPERLRGLGVQVELRTPPFAPRELAELTLAALQRQHPPPTGHTRPTPLGMSGRKHVLVVEDNPVNQILAREMVQLLGFEVDVVGCGEQALEYCRNHAPHAVLMDLQMPGMDGFEATRQLRKLQREGALPPFAIVAATASTAVRQDCLSAGMDGFIAKPLSLVELGVLLRESVG